MYARDIMSTAIVSTTPDASVLDAAALLVDKHISAIPVLSGDRVVGILSEADLLRRYELGTQREAAAVPWWRRVFGGGSEPWNYVEAHAMKVRDVMTPRVVSVAEDTSMEDIAALFESHRIKRAPVLDANGRMVGIVSRADFVRALVARAKAARDAQPTDDESIRRALLAELTAQPWWHPDRSEVIVSGGVVHYAGSYDSPEEVVAARVAAEGIPGVRAVEDGRSISIPAAGYRAF